MSTSTNLREVTQLAGEDRRAARLLAAAEADARRAEQDRAAADAAAERELRLASGRVDIDAKRRAARRTEQGEIDAQRRAQRAARRSERRARAAARRAWVGARIDYARRNAPAVYSAGIYGLAVAGAVYGQITAATGRGWPLLVGLVVAAALEGLALSMALTAHQLRLAGERAMAPRALTWVAALAASAINYFGHVDADPTGAIVLAALSVVGIIVWEIRSGAKHRTALREAGMIPDPPARFGWRRWVRFPAGTLAAWSRDVRDRVSPQAADVLAAMAAERAERARTVRARQVARMARAELAAARKRKDGPAVAAALVRLAAGDDLAAVPSIVPANDAHTASQPSPDGAAPAPALTWAMSDSGPSDTPSHTHARVGVSVDGSVNGSVGAGADGSADVPAPVHTGTGAPVRSGVRTGTAVAAGTSQRTSARATVRVDATPDVSALLPAGAAVRARLATAGRALTRDALVAGLREDGHAVSNRRASALLAALNTTDVPPATQPA